MFEKYRFLYLGNDDEFLNEIELTNDIYLAEKHEINSFKFTPGSLASLAYEKLHHVVYVDFVSNKDHEQIISELIFLKKHKHYQRTLFVAVLDEKIDHIKRNLIFASGFQVGFIKGSEFVTFHLDILYMSTEENIEFPKFAQARGIHKATKISACSSITKMTTDAFYIDTDIDVLSDEIQTKLPMFPEKTQSVYQVLEHQNFPMLYPNLDHYALQYPVASSENKKPVTKASIASWLSENKSQLIREDAIAKIINKNTSFIKKLFSRLSNIPFIIDIFESFDKHNLKQQLSDEKPSLIFYEMKTLDESEEGEEQSIEDIENLAYLRDCIALIDNYNPVIVASNSLSTSKAMQKAYDYPQFLSFKDELSVEIVENFLNTYVKKMEETKSINGYFLHYADNRRAIDIDFDIEITSLSEHEVTFTTYEDLPIYTTLHLNLPIDCHVTIIPADRELHKTEGNHYMGLIHSIDETERSLLRRFVNQIIFKPIDEFSEENVQKVLAHEYEKIEARKEVTEKYNQAKGQTEEAPEKLTKSNSMVSKSRGVVTNRDRIERSKL